VDEGKMLTLLMVIPHIFLDNSLFVVEALLVAAVIVIALDARRPAKRNFPRADQAFARVAPISANGCPPLIL
jgi:hypothetical protein